MKALIIGLGSIAYKHIAALRNIDAGVEIVALRSSRTSPSVVGVKSVYTLAEAIAESPDFVIVSTPTARHAESIRMALTMKVPLFIEKPLLHTLPEAEEVAQEIVDSGVLNYVACNLRFLECLGFVKDYISSGSCRINEVNSYCGSWLPGWRPGVDFREVYSARPEMGGGVHIDLIHEIDTLYWLFGMPEDVRKTLRNRSSLDINAVDYANYCMTYADFCASVILNYYRRDYRRTLEIVMENETMLVDLARNCVTAGNRIVFESSRTILDTYESQMRYFINLVESEAGTSFNTVSDALNTLSLSVKGRGEREQVKGKRG